MTTIDPNAAILTLINTFEVTPERQQELLELLTEATEECMRHIDGFISANLHASPDGKHVANYAQWKSTEHFESMLQNPEAQVHMRAARELAVSITPIVYEAKFSHTN